MSLRRRGLAYADKTDLVYLIAHDTQPKILSRPSGFGKSLLASTLEELFRHGVKPYDGHDSCFKDLKIEKLWDDERTYPVIKLDLSALNAGCHNAAAFKSRLCLKLDAYAAQLGITLLGDEVNPSDKLKAIAQSHEFNSLVLLVDAYDAPLRAHCGSQSDRKLVLSIIRGLFSATKTCKSHFRCIFFTGIARFRNLQLGTCAGNTCDITLGSTWADCCGLTRREIREGFDGNLRYAAAVRLGKEQNEVADQDLEALLDQLQQHFGSYAFDDTGMKQVFLPLEVLRFFSDPRAAFELSGISDPDFLKLLKAAMTHPSTSRLLEALRQGAVTFSRFAFVQGEIFEEVPHPLQLLFEEGLLTFRESPREQDEVSLDCPNRKAREALSRLLAAPAL